MTIAFVPGILVAGLVGLACLPREAWRRGLVNLGLLCLAAVAVAAPWYIPNFDLVAEYLTEFGYGERSAEYGASHSIISWDRWTDVLARIAADDLYLVLAILVIAGLVALLVTAIRRVEGAEDRAAALRGVLGSGPAAVGIVALAGYVALSSSRNIGLGFTLPVSVLLVPLAIAALPRFPRARTPVLAIVAIATAVNLLASFTLSESLSRRSARSASRVPARPRSSTARHTRSRKSATRSTAPRPASTRPTRASSTSTASWPKRFAVRLGKQVVAFGSRNRVVNTNSVMLAGLRQYDEAIPMAQLRSTDGPTAADFAARLGETDFGLPQVVVTASTNARDFEPRVEPGAGRKGRPKPRDAEDPDDRRSRTAARCGSGPRPPSGAPRRSRSSGTLSAASATIIPPIFEEPAARSRKTIGTSTTRKPELDRPVGRLDLEGIAAGLQRVEVDRLQDLAAEALEAAGQVPHLHAEREAGVGAAAAADRLPQPAPVRDPAAGHVAGPDHEVGALGRLEQPRQVGGVMGEVGVHLQHQAGAGLERPVESGDVGGAEAFLARAAQDLDLLVPGREPLGDLPGAVGRVVVDDQHPARGRHLGQDRLDDRLDIRRLVVGREHEPRRTS